MNGQVRRVCVAARPWHGGIGDFIPVNIFLHLVRRAFPRAEVTQIVGAETTGRLSEYFSAHSHADRVVACPNQWDDDLGHWEAFFDRIKDEGYGCCVLDPSAQFLMAAGMAGAGVGIRLGVATGGEGDRFLTAPITLSPPEHCQPDLLDFARGLAGALGLPVPLAGGLVPPFRYRPEVVPELPGPVVAVQPGGARHWNRRWPLARFGELCRGLARSVGASFVLAGSGDEAVELDWLAEAIGPGVRVEVCAGLSLNRVASFLDASDVLVGNDSALAHIAAALGKPTVVLYGPTGTEFMCQRVYPRHRGINRHHLCAPYQERPPGSGVSPCRFSCESAYQSAEGPYPRCLADIEVDEVHAMVKEQLTEVTRAAR